jgi:type I restriction enzyme S subunit
MVSILKNPPRNWNIVKISDVLFYQEGPGVRKHQFRDEGVKLLNGGNINDGYINLNKTKKYISEEEAYGKYSHFLINEGDLLIACSGIVVENFHNKIAFVEKEHLPLCLNTSTMRFNKLNDDEIDLIYFKYFLQTKIFTSQLRRLITGSAQLNFGPSHIRKIDLLLPPLVTQKKIAVILGEADKIRQLNKELIKKYGTLSQSLFLEMFGDPVGNTKDWVVKKIKDISIKIHSGNTPKGGSDVYVDKGIVFFRSQNVWKNRLELDNVAFIDEKTHSKMMKSSLKNRDLLMTKTGRINTENSSLGRAAMFEGEDDSANVNGHVYLIRLQKEIVNEFVLHILTTNEYREYIRRICVGGIDKRQLNKDHIENFPIIFPPIELQRKFVQRLNAVKQLEKQAQASLQKSEDLFNSLLQKAFKGELVK